MEVTRSGVNASYYFIWVETKSSYEKELREDMKSPVGI